MSLITSLVILLLIVIILSLLAFIAQQPKTEKISRLQEQFRIEKRKDEETISHLTLELEKCGTKSRCTVNIQPVEAPSVRNSELRTVSTIVLPQDCSKRPTFVSCACSALTVIERCYYRMELAAKDCKESVTCVLSYK